MKWRLGARRAGAVACSARRQWPLRAALLAVASILLGPGAQASASLKRTHPSVSAATIRAIAVVLDASRAAMRSAPLSYQRPLPRLTPLRTFRRVRPILPSGAAGPLPLSHWPRQRRHLAGPTASAAIIGGTAASQGQLGFMAFIVYQVSSTAFQLCSGTVVAPNVVLTAGHCAIDESTGTLLNPAQFAVVTGAVDWTNASLRQVSDVSQIIVDPLYHPLTATSDAALLVLSTPTTAPSIGLATAADQSLEQPGTNAIIAGWGETYPGSAPTQTLEWASTVVQNPAYCSIFNFAPFTYNPALKLCSVNPPNTGTCNGDSGGPLLASNASNQPVEIGLTSYGPSDCNTVSADFFTTVAPLSSWVGKEIQAVATGPPPSGPTPPPRLPRLTIAAARSYARQTLAARLRKVFKARVHFTLSCRRASSTRANCGFTFSSRQNFYYGNVTVYYASGSAGKVYWANRYTIHWVNDYCYFRSGHRGSCKVHTKRGSW